MDKLKELAHHVGLEPAIIYFFLARVFAILSTPTVLFLVSSRLTPTEQGFYFTFYSLVSLSLFFELGLGVVLTYFSSHEYSRLSWDAHGLLGGEPRALGRLSGMLRQALKWYGVICAAFAIIVLVVGYYILSRQVATAQIHFAVPWLLVVLFFSLGTSIIPITSVLDGCGQIGKTQKMRFSQGLGSAIASATVLFFNGRLYAVPAEFAASFTIFVIWVFRNYRKVIWQLLTLPDLSGKQIISWRQEVFPMQLRVALNVIAAYFQGYVIVPLAFRFNGAPQAGMMGMSMRFVNSIFTLSVGWINIRTPAMAAAASAGNIEETNRIAKVATMRALLTSSLGVAAFLTIIVAMERYYPTFPRRMLPLGPTMALAATVPLSVLIGGFSAYLRSYKIEPYGFPGIVASGVNFIACFLSAYYGSVSIIAYAYACQIFLFTFPYYLWIFLRRRREVLTRQLSKAVFIASETAASQ